MKMKIAVFTPYNIFKPGGVQEHVNLQVEALRSKGHTVTVITPRPRKTYAHEAPEGVIFLGASARLKTTSATSADVSVTPYGQRIDEILSEGYDVLHVHEPLVPVAARQLLMRAEGKAMRVGTFHAALPGNTLGKSLISTFKAYVPAIMPHLDIVTAVSPAATGFIEDYSEYSNVEISYIPNCIDVSKFAAPPQERDQNMVFFMGRLEKRKGALQAVKAFAVLKERKPEARLVIASDGPLRASLEQYVQTNEIDDVEFLGVISDEQKIQLLSTCGIYTSPALYGESFGIVLAEAMAMGAPIVAHPNEGYKWTLRETGRLSLVNCKDPEEYAERMQLMLEDTAVRATWQKWAKKYVKQFDIKFVAKQYEELYKRSLKSIQK